MKKIGLVLLFIFYAMTANAAIYNIEMTVDNAYVLFSGDSSGLTHIGQTVGDWSTTETYSNIEFSDGDYVYVYAWDWGSVEGFVGEFLTQDSNFESFITGTNNGWEVKIFPEVNGSNYTLYLSTPDVLNKINDSAIAWSSVNYFKPTSRWPNGTTVVQGIDSEAVWIWGLLQDVNSSGDMLFRHQIKGTSISPVPEPATMLLLGSGLLGLFGFKRKRKV